jgi:hypothetical protein
MPPFCTRTGFSALASSAAQIRHYVSREGAVIFDHRQVAAMRMSSSISPGDRGPPPWSLHAYQAIKTVSLQSIGMYRGSFLQLCDGFGVGCHPRQRSFQHNDLDFWFDTVLDKPNAG